MGNKLKMGEGLRTVFEQYESIRLVYAACVTAVRPTHGPNGDTLMVSCNLNGSSFSYMYDVENKPVPMVGGYLVVYDDGYVSFCPRDSFEKGYRKLNEYDRQRAGELPENPHPPITLQHPEDFDPLTN